MTKFSEYKYIEQDFVQLAKDYSALIEEFKNAPTAKKQIEAYKRIDELDRHTQTAFTLVSIRFSQNVNDKYYSAQQNIIDEEAPKLQAVLNELNKNSQLFYCFLYNIHPICLS